MVLQILEEFFLILGQTLLFQKSHTCLHVQNLLKKQSFDIKMIYHTLLDHQLILFGLLNFLKNLSSLYYQVCVHSILMIKLFFSILCCLNFIQNLLCSMSVLSQTIKYVYSNSFTLINF